MYSLEVFSNFESLFQEKDISKLAGFEELKREIKLRRKLNISPRTDADEKYFKVTNLLIIADLIFILTLNQLDHLY